MCTVDVTLSYAASLIDLFTPGQAGAALAALRCRTREGLTPGEEHLQEGRGRVAAAVAAGRRRLGAAAEQRLALACGGCHDRLGAVGRTPLRL